MKTLSNRNLEVRALPLWETKNPISPANFASPWGDYRPPPGPAEKSSSRIPGCCREIVFVAAAVGNRITRFSSTRTLILPGVTRKKSPCLALIPCLRGPNIYKKKHFGPKTHCTILPPKTTKIAHAFLALQQSTTRLLTFSFPHSYYSGKR